jgi:hypothetical protein
MKFFTPEALDDFYEYEPFSTKLQEYREHLLGLHDVLSPEVLALAELLGMDDGLVVRVDHNRIRRVLKLILRCGNVQMGYYNLLLVYKGADLSLEHDSALARIARTTITKRRYGCDLAYHKLDASDEGKIEHRMIFCASESYHPFEKGYIWFSIRCDDLLWRRESRRTRRLPPIDDRYPDGPQD